MVQVISQGMLLTMEAGWWTTGSHGSLRMYDQYNYDYATLYRLQPNIRVCVDFLARNIAQLGLHVFRRVSETDRVRLRDHPLAQLISRPLPAEHKVTRYRLIEGLMADLGIYYNAYWLKLRREDGKLFGLMRIPPAYVKVQGALSPQSYKIIMSGKSITVQPENMVHFRGYNADNALVGLSPLETLRRVLAEEHSMGKYREGFWRNAARISGIIERPADAPEWSPTARERFTQEFGILYSGDDNSGKTAVLEDGMEWKQAAFNAQESEYLGGRKLTREECARSYHIPLPMVGILDHATFSNIREQHKNLYQDSLGPWLRMIEEEIALQVLPDFVDEDGVYCEFNIQEKLAGSFEEQTTALQAAVGRPWMTSNEARARMNLPSIAGGDELVTPLNVLIGGQASPQDSAPKASATTETKAMDTKALDTHNAELRQRHEEKWRQQLARHYRRQEAAIISRVPDPPGKSDLGGLWYDEERWNRELYEDLLPLNTMTANTWAGMAVGALEADVDLAQMEALMQPWLAKHSEVQAAYLNNATRDALAIALQDAEPRNAVKALFGQATAVWAVGQAVSAVTNASNFGSREGAKASGLRRKTWQVNSSNPRSEHAAMNGETVDIDGAFSNGLRWPGDPMGGGEDNANCQCSLRYS